MLFLPVTKIIQKSTLLSMMHSAEILFHIGIHKNRPVITILTIILIGAYIVILNANIPIQNYQKDDPSAPVTVRCHYKCSYVHRKW